MTGPSSTPRGERAGHPGTAWETELRYVEVLVPDDHDESPFGWSTPDPQPNRATRRALARARRKGTQ